MTPESPAANNHPLAMTVDELAAYFGVSPSSVRSWVFQGCPAYSLNQRPVTAPHARLRFDLQAVIRWHTSYSKPISLLPALQAPTA